MKRGTRYVLAGAAVLAAVGFASASEAASPGFSGELTVVLHGALFRGPAPADGAEHLVLDAEADGGAWGRAWGMALGYNNAVHYGLVRGCAINGGSVRLDVEMKIAPDQRTPGGRGLYAIRLKRGADGKCEGSFEGTFKGRKVSGAASGEVRTPRPVRAKGLQPCAAGEHPRMLFRKADLPRLREKLKTPFGKAYLAAANESRDLISLGVLYQLTGKRQYADEALKLIQAFKPPSPYPPAMPAGEERKIAEAYQGDIDPHPSGSGSVGHRLVEVSFAYDLCCDAWPEAFRRQLAARLLGVIQYRQMRLHPGHSNYHPCSNYYGPSYGSSGLASLAVWGEKGPAPARPAVPFNVGSDSGQVAPAAGYRPGKGVPVTKYADGTMSPEWIYVGGLKPAEGEDPLAPLGGAGKARPEVGVEVRCGGRTEAFGALSHEKDKGYYGEMIDITSACGRAYRTTSYFYSVIDNDKPRWASVRTDYEPAVVYLAGARCREGDVVHLKKGLYPMLAAAYIGATAPWGRHLMRPRLVELTAEDAAAEIAHRRAEHELDLALWEADRAAWEASGGVDPVKELYAGISHRRMCWHYRLGMGDGGFQAETGVYARIGAWYPLVYATAYRKMHGRDASPHPDVTHLMPRRMMQVLFGKDGKQAVEKINSDVGFFPWWCAAGFPIAPQAYQPGLLWAWNHSRGVTDEASRVNIIRRPEEKAPPRGLDMAHALVHYPLETKGVHPGKCMPLTWEAPDFGYYCFRSGWQGDDEFIAQVFLKAKMVGGWNHGNAGTFRVYGLGRGWVATPESRNGVRAQEPVVYLPADEHNENACGRLTHLETAKDGSGSLTIDLGDVYSAPGRGLYDRNLIRRGEGFAASGITGLRALAFDYSRASGAPCLMVLVDRVVGDRQKEWYWQLIPAGRKQAEAAAEVRVEAGGFTLDYGDATMRATFVAPAAAQIQAGVEQIKIRDARHGYHGPAYRVKAVAPNPADGDFFVIVTFQRGRPQPVKVDGAGLGAKVTVGGQTVRFDGKKIVLGG